MDNGHFAALTPEVELYLRVGPRVERACCGDPKPWRWKVIVPTVYGEHVSAFTLTRWGARRWARRNPRMIVV